MEKLRSKKELRDWIAKGRKKNRILVPTMGALHEGHTSLFDLAVKHAEGGDVIATIFVNPTQFGPNEDFEAYPRQLEQDLIKCESHGVTAVFLPEKSEMYAEDTSIQIHENQLSKRLCGSSRPGHFDGVCTIVAKLFLLTQPDGAVFGEKDFQQLAVIRRLVQDLDFPIKIIPGATVREPDGLAMSSRNAGLTTEQRAQAPLIQQSLSCVAEGIASRKYDSPDSAAKALHQLLESASSGETEYAEIVDASTLGSLESFKSADPRLLAAVRFGRTRLIDNIGVPLLNE